LEITHLILESSSLKLFPLDGKCEDQWRNKMFEPGE